jgi:hypothetical protein
MFDSVLQHACSQATMSTLLYSSWHSSIQRSQTCKITLPFSAAGVRLLLLLLLSLSDCVAGMSAAARRELQQYLEQQRTRLAGDAAHAALQVQRKSLPAAACKKDLLRLLNEHQVQGAGPVG